MKRRLYWLLIIVMIMIPTACGSPPLIKPENEAPVGANKATPTEANNATQDLTEAHSSPLPTPKITQPSTSPRPSTPTTVAIAQAVTTPVTTTVSPSPLPPTVPAGPAPSPTTPPLSPLDESLQTIVFAANSEQGPAIWRTQVDAMGQIAGPVEPVNFPADTLTQIYDLFPSPDGNYVAVVWFYGDGMASFVHILDVSDGQLTPLFGEEEEIHPAVTFLDWVPDGRNILVMGIPGNPDLRNNAWLVNVETRAYHKIPIEQVRGRPYVNAASFSPDGKMIAYAQSDCSRCGSEIWRVTLDNTERQILFQDSQTVVMDVLWSPSGDHIAFTTRPVDAQNWEKFIIGELRLMKPDGSEERLLSSMVTYFLNQSFRPTWSPNGQEIAFVMNEDSDTEQRLDELSSNIYIVNILSDQVQQLTQTQDSPAFKPVWSPTGRQVAFLTGEDRPVSRLRLNTVAIDGGEVRSSDANSFFLEDTSNNLDVPASFTWLP